MNPSYEMTELSAAQIDVVSGASAEAVGVMVLGVVVIGIGLGMELGSGGLVTPLAFATVAAGVAIVHTGAAGQAAGH